MASEFLSGMEQDGTDSERVASNSSAETNDVAMQVEETAVKNRSVVWMYFRKVASKDGVKVQCELCNKTVKTTGRNTTNLLSHLKTKYSKKYFEVKWKADEEKKKSTIKKSSKKNPPQATLTDITTNKTKLDTSSRPVASNFSGGVLFDENVDLILQQSRCRSSWKVYVVCALPTFMRAFNKQFHT